MIYGYELIIDLKGCSNINKKSLGSFVKELCKLIEIKRWGKTQIVYFGKDRFKGYSLFQFITTSSICGHFTADEVYLNIFSCKEFGVKHTVSFIKKWFSTNNCKYKFIRR